MNLVEQKQENPDENEEDEPDDEVSIEKVGHQGAITSFTYEMGVFCCLGELNPKLQEEQTAFFTRRQGGV